MDPVLPFRALSPGTRNPKSSQQRNRDTKLSLKTRKVSTAGHDGKENRAPLTQRNFKKSNFRLSDSELITSDESDSSDLDVGTDKRQQSVMTLNSQESTFSLPVAESTRCELPARNKIGHVESTMASLHTALNGSSSSSGAEYHTACPFPTGCDESIICISDSSPESVKKTVKKTNIISESVLLTSDESECQSPPKSTKKNIFSSLRKCEEKRKLYDTVILESTDEEDCSVSVGDYRNCDIVIPPSVKSVNSPCSSLVSSTNSHLGIDGKVIPPSPERYSESSANGSLISEDGDKNTSRLHKIKVSKDRSSPLYLEANERKQCAQYFDIGQSQECPKEPDLTSSSWKDDFRLVMEESTDGSKDKSDCKDQSLKESSQKKVTGSISKEKYNDIARWLISGGNSESESDGSALCDKRLPKHQVGNVPDVSSPRESRFPARKTCSSGSESDDNFEALMASIRKKQNDDERKTSNRGNSSRNDSFIDDGVASDVVDSPSFNIYHSDLTKSIKAEIKHVKKSVKSVTQKKLFGYEDDTEEDQNTPIKDKPKKVVRNQLDSLRKVGPSNVEPHESKPICKTSKKAQVLKTDTSDSSDSKSPLSHKVSVNRKMRLKKSVKRFNSVESSESDVSSSEDPVQSKTPLWRNIKAGIGSDGSGSTSSSKLNLPKSKPKDTSKITANVPKSITQLKTPKNIAALKSPQTPYSPIRTFLSSLSGPTHEPGVRDHPEAVTYNENFKAKKEELTRRLFKLFNREVFDRRLPDDMVLEWNARLVRTAGLCYCKLIRKGGVTSRTTKIDLSTKVITSPDRLRDTLIHEMCHAAVWLLNNVSGGHGPFWKAWAHKAMKRFPELPCIERCHSYNIETKYTYRCSKCGYSFGRHSKSLDLDKKRCGYCYGTFEVFLSSKVGPNTKEKDLKTPKAPSAFALFVKENYGLVKQDHSSFKHGDIMKKLGEKFAQMKVKQSAS